MAYNCEDGVSWLHFVCPIEGATSDRPRPFASIPGATGSTE